jgi:hypothetical protein
MVLLERWTLAHERTAADVGSPGSPSSLPRRPSLFESARSLEVPVIYKRTARADTAASRCSRVALTRTHGTGDYAALALHIAAHAAGAPPVSSLQGAVACARCGHLSGQLMRCSCHQHAACPFTLVYSIHAPTAAPPTQAAFSPADDCGRFDFTPVQTPVGLLSATVSFRSHTVRKPLRRQPCRRRLPPLLTRPRRRRTAQATAALLDACGWAGSSGVLRGAPSALASPGEALAPPRILSEYACATPGSGSGQPAVAGALTVRRNTWSTSQQCAPGRLVLKCCSRPDASFAAPHFARRPQPAFKLSPVAARIDVNAVACAGSARALPVPDEDASWMNRHACAPSPPLLLLTRSSSALSGAPLL